MKLSSGLKHVKFQEQFFEQISRVLLFQICYWEKQLPKYGNLKHIFERNEIMLVEERYSLYTEQADILNMKVISGVSLLHWGLFMLTKFLRDVREKGNTGINMTTFFAVCYQNSQYNRHGNKGILSEHIMIYLKYNLLSWILIISASSVNNFILLQKISRNLSVVPPVRKWSKYI